METISDKTLSLIDRDAPLFRYQQVAVASVLVTAARDAHLLNLSIAQIATLHLVGMRQHMRVGEIADALGMQLPGASKLVADMVARGLCTRSDDDDDRRAKVVTTTPAGVELIEEMSHSTLAEFPAGIAGAAPDVVETINLLFDALREAGLASGAKTT